VIERSLAPRWKTRRPRMAIRSGALRPTILRSNVSLDRELSAPRFQRARAGPDRRADGPLAEPPAIRVQSSPRTWTSSSRSVPRNDGRDARRRGPERRLPLWESFVADRRSAPMPWSDRQYEIYQQQIIPAWPGTHRVLSHSKRTPAQRAWVKEYFEREVRRCCRRLDWTRHTRSRR